MLLVSGSWASRKANARTYQIRQTPKLSLVWLIVVIPWVARSGEMSVKSCYQVRTSAGLQPEAAQSVPHSHWKPLAMRSCLFGIDHLPFFMQPTASTLAGSSKPCPQRLKSGRLSREIKDSKDSSTPHLLIAHGGAFAFGSKAPCIFAEPRVLPSVAAGRKTRRTRNRGGNSCSVNSLTLYLVMHDYAQ